MSAAAAAEQAGSRRPWATGARVSDTDSHWKQKASHQLRSSCWTASHRVVAGAAVGERLQTERRGQARSAAGTLQGPSGREVELTRDD